MLSSYRAADKFGENSSRWFFCVALRYVCFPLHTGHVSCDPQRKAELCYDQCISPVFYVSCCCGQLWLQLLCHSGKPGKNVAFVIKFRPVWCCVIISQGVNHTRFGSFPFSLGDCWPLTFRPRSGGACDYCRWGERADMYMGRRGTRWDGRGSCLMSHELWHPSQCVFMFERGHENYQRVSVCLPTMCVLKCNKRNRVTIPST